MGRPPSARPGPAQVATDSAGGGGAAAGFRRGQTWRLRRRRRSRAPRSPVDNAQPLDLSALTSIVGYPLRRAQLAVFEDFNRRFAALKLSPAQYSALVVIAANPGRKQSEIAGALGIQRPNFVAMMDELERRGLAERLRTPDRPPLARPGADRRRRGPGRARAPRAGRAGKGSRTAHRPRRPRTTGRRVGAAGRSRDMKTARSGRTPFCRNFADDPLFGKGSIRIDERKRRPV